MLVPILVQDGSIMTQQILLRSAESDLEGHGARHSCGIDVMPRRSVDKQLHSPGSGQTEAHTVK